MKASKLIVLLLSLSLVLALTACGGSSTSAGTASAEPASSDEGITVGGLWALTGFMADYEIPGSEGFELALEEINNNGGIDGHPVTYISYDSQSDVAQATSLMTKLIESGGADVVFGLAGRDCAVEDIERVYHHLEEMVRTGKPGPLYIHMGQRSSAEEVL